MDEFLELLARHTTPDKLRVRQFSGIIFLCGGPTTDTDVPPKSARDFFLRYIRDESPPLYDRIFLAEQVNAWAADMIRERYTPDLLTFESHVSGLASAVSLIVESPGSIAELGSFCLLAGVQERLMVVVREGWMNEDSFISLGPIAFLRESIGDSHSPIHTYPWQMRYDERTREQLPNLRDLAAQANVFVEDLAAFEDALPQRPKWNSQSRGHVSLLISDLVALFSALRVPEILRFLSAIGLPDIDRKTISSHIFLLEKLKFVKKVSYRANDYYVSTVDRSFVDLNLTGAPAHLRNRDRFRVVVADVIQNEDHSRALAIRRGRETRE